MYCGLKSLNLHQNLALKCPLSFELQRLISTSGAQHFYLSGYFMLGSWSPRSTRVILVQFLFVLVHIYLLQWGQNLSILIGTPWTISKRAKIPKVHAHQMQDIAGIVFMRLVLHTPLWLLTWDFHMFEFFFRSTFCLTSGNSRKMKTYF